MKDILVSEEDRDLLDIKWYHEKSGYLLHSEYIYINGVRKRKNIRLHRVVMERVLGNSIPKNTVVDHINGNTEDNKRSNLRIVTRIQNAQNRSIDGWGKSGITGVLWCQTSNRWIVKLTIDKRQRYFGRFTNLKEAENMCKKVRSTYFGEYARVN